MEILNIWYDIYWKMVYNTYQIHNTTIIKLSMILAPFAYGFGFYILPKAIEK